MGLGLNRKAGETVWGSAFSRSIGGITRHEITLSPAFFTTPALDTLLADQVGGYQKPKEKGTQDGYALKGSIIHHELRHLDIGGLSSHHVRPAVGGRTGQRWSMNLANGPKDLGGDASRASTNAESYAVLASAL